MSHNYSKHFNNNQQNNHKPLFGQSVNSSVEKEDLPSEENSNVESVDETTNVTEKTNGVVCGCETLFVRSEANKESSPLTIIEKDSKVEIDLDQSTEDFYKVTIESGIEGYCMKKFIEIK